MHIKNYVRYNDDFFVVSESESYLREQAEVVKVFSRAHLRLNLPENKIVVRLLATGVDVLGEVLYPWGAVPRLRLKRKSLVVACQNSPVYTLFRQRSIVSYLGLLKNMRSYHLSEKLRLAARP